jgi:hypothetical protein
MKKALLALAAVLAPVLKASALGDDFSQGKSAKAAPNWKVLSLGSGHWTQKPANAFADGIGFAFGTTPNPRLFLTTHLGGLLGDLTGKTLTAQIDQARRSRRLRAPRSQRSVWFTRLPSQSRS